MAHCSSQVVAGNVGPATNWRLPFVIVAAPSLLVALVMLLTTQEPPRGAFEEALQQRYTQGQQYTETVSWSKVKSMLRVPSNLLCIAQGLPGSLPWGVVLTYLNDYLSQSKVRRSAVLRVVLPVLTHAAAGIEGWRLPQ